MIETQIKFHPLIRTLTGALWKGLSFLGLVSLGVLSVKGAQYNFHVNSIEQGANSTANPILNVSPGKVEKIGAGTLNSTESTGQTPPLESVPVSPVTPQTRASFENSADEPLFNIGISAMSTRFAGDNSAAWKKDRVENQGLDVQGQLGLYPISYLGFNAFGGSFRYSTRRKFLLGAELHLIPVKLDVLGMEEMFEIGLMGGVWNLVPDSKDSKTWARAFAGAKASLNFGRKAGSKALWAVNGAVRGNQDLMTADLGLSYKF
jgi:hypothetical protein